MVKIDIVSDDMKKSAIISSCGQYRYLLTRDWNICEDGTPLAHRRVAFVGLNPSTADAEMDDPTLRRCIGFAKAWGYNGLIMANLFAFRATDPQDMMSAADPIGPRNSSYLEALAEKAEMIIACWGRHGQFMEQGKYVMSILPENLCYLRLNKDGSPGHPLYLPKSLKPTSYSGVFDKRIPSDGYALSDYAISDRRDRVAIVKEFPHLAEDFKDLGRALFNGGHD